MKRDRVYYALACVQNNPAYPELTDFDIYGRFSNLSAAAQAARKNSVKGLEESSKVRIVYEPLFDTPEEYAKWCDLEKARDTQANIDLQAAFDKVSDEFHADNNIVNYFKHSKGNSAVIDSKSDSKSDSVKTL